MSQINNDGNDARIFKLVVLQYNWNSIERIEMRRCCMIILKENIIMSKDNNDGYDISDYSWQFFSSILEHYTTGIKEEGLSDYSDRKYNYFPW